MKKEKIYLKNTLTKKLEEFVPIEVDKVRMYNCGPTVYDRAHIGNLRAYVFADILRRMFEYNDYEVQQVINITDVGHLTNDEELGDGGEDKMEKSARKNKVSAQDLARRNTEEFIQDLEALNINTEVIIFPRVTEYIDEQILMIRTLEEKGYTYLTSDGVYFDTSLFKDYGKLGNINIEGLQEGARIGKNFERKNITDFALWKFSKPEESRQQEWKSPWGVGFPGWHIECSAMSRVILGKTIDVHTGGIDHIPIHHNNEIAQSECASSKKFVNYWMHGAHLMIEGKKISKSIGNTLALYQLKDRGIAESVYRYWLLTAHYSTQVNFTWETLLGARKALVKLNTFIMNAPEGGEINKKYQKEFLKLINNDLDMPQAVALMWKLFKDEKVSFEDIKATMLDFDRVFGLNLGEQVKNKRSITIDETTDEVKNLIEAREKARKDKEWQLADEIRDKITVLGYEITDTPTGTISEKL